VIKVNYLVNGNLPMDDPWKICKFADSESQKSKNHPWFLQDKWEKY